MLTAAAPLQHNMLPDTRCPALHTARNMASRGMAAEVQQLAAQLLAQRSPAAPATAEGEDEGWHEEAASNWCAEEEDGSGGDMPTRPCTLREDGSAGGVAPDGFSNTTATGTDMSAPLHPAPDHSVRERKRALLSAVAAAGSSTGSGSSQAAAAQQELAGVQMRLKTVLGLQDEACRGWGGATAGDDAGQWKQEGMFLDITSEVEAMAAWLLARHPGGASARAPAGATPR